MTVIYGFLSPLVCPSPLFLVCSPAHLCKNESGQREKTVGLTLRDVLSGGGAAVNGSSEMGRSDGTLSGPAPCP